MPFLIRPSRRFPVCCPVTYQCGLFEGHGTVWNLSLTGWRFSGKLPLRIGEVCSLTVNPSFQKSIYVAAGLQADVQGNGLIFGVTHASSSLCDIRGGCAPSDRGPQYAAATYRELLAGHSLTASMSWRANCWEHAVAESFFHTLKTELVHHRRYQT